MIKLNTALMKQRLDYSYQFIYAIENKSEEKQEDFKKSEQSENSG